MRKIGEHIPSRAPLRQLFSWLFLLLVCAVIFSVSSAQASHYLDNKILAAGESEMTRTISDGSDSRAFDFRHFWSIPIRDKLNHMISLNDSESSKAQQALDNLNNDEGYIVSTLSSFPGVPIEVAFYDVDAEVDFYQYYHPSATAYAYRAASSPIFI